jgi:hypothetical protein
VLGPTSIDLNILIVAFASMLKTSTLVSAQMAFPSRIPLHFSFNKCCSRCGIKNRNFPRFSVLICQHTPRFGLQRLPCPAFEFSLRDSHAKRYPWILSSRALLVVNVSLGDCGSVEPRTSGESSPACSFLHPGACLI